jgi:hypothetical protein
MEDLEVIRQMAEKLGCNMIDVPAACKTLSQYLRDLKKAMASGGKVPSVILFRMRNQTPTMVTPRLFKALEMYREPLLTGAIVIVEDAAYRLRRLPIRSS